jgi:uracil phosphoribosyltransferase
VLRIVDHPLVHDALVELRDARTPHSAFRRAARRISVLLAAEALRDAPAVACTVETPLGPAEGRVLDGDIVAVPVLRAGLGMLEAILELVPKARVGHIGLQRDEATAIASKYYARLPHHLEQSYVLLLDPILATGGSAVASVDVIKASG